MKKKICLTIALITALCFTWQTAQSQLAIETGTYRTAIGVRAGGTSGLTVKHFFGGAAAIEGIVGFWPGAFSLTGLYERHANAFDVEGLYWYYGAGGHLRVYPGDYNRHRGRWWYREGEGVGIGVDGIVGLEYKIPPIPFAISLDLKPYVEATTGGAFFGWIDPGLGIKLTF